MITQRLAHIPTVLEDGQIQLRTDTIFEEKGTELFRQHHRQVLAPGDDVSSHPKRIKDICGIVWTQAVIDAYKAQKAINEGH